MLPFRLVPLHELAYAANRQKAEYEHKDDGNKAESHQLDIQLI